MERKGQQTEFAGAEVEMRQRRRDAQLQCGWREVGGGRGESGGRWGGGRGDRQVIGGLTVARRRESDWKLLRNMSCEAAGGAGPRLSGSSF